MKIAVLLFDGFTMLDAVGPLEVLSLVPDVEILITAKFEGVIWPDNQAIPLIAPYSIADVYQADVLLIPGGPGSATLEKDSEILDWIRQINSTSQWTCSVCTGSLVLGAAGLLEGVDATTHWSVLSRLSEYGATPLSKRWVERGRIITAAGVSAGIDMALLLASRLTDERVAQAIQLAIEYDPAPPFKCGSIERAGPEVVAAVLDGAIEFNRSQRRRPIIPNAS